MNLFILSLALTVAGNVCYHLLNKTVSGNAHPFASLAATYAVALVASLAVLIVDAPKGLAPAMRELNWASYALGVTVIALELGFLLAYRAGWRISVASLYSNLSVALLLIPFGLLLYRESLTTANIAGIALAVVSLALMSR